MMKTRDYLKNISYWTIPQGMRDSLINIYRQNNKSKSQYVDLASITKKNLAFKNKHQGERCFILATGPSIKRQNLDCLQGEICLAVSHFFLHQDIQKIAPKYHILAPYHPPFDFQTLEKVFQGFDANYDPNITYFFGHRPYEHSIYDFLQYKHQYKRKNSFFIDYSNSSNLDEKNYLDKNSWDISHSPFSIRTVIYSAIQIAIYLGCKQIYLVGCDHDYLNDTSRVTNHHFYREEDGVSDAEHLSSFTTEKWFGEYYYRWKEYRLMKEYAATIGVQIFNATEGGMLDVFPRVSLDLACK